MIDSALFPDRAKTEDEFAWLEEIEDERALAWVTEQNAITDAALKNDRLEATQAMILEVLDAPERIPFAEQQGPFLYNLWRDADHPRGLWRRTTMASYRTPAPVWETLIDVDALGRAEGTDWVFAEAELRFPDFARALVRLSPDGGDAEVVREFDLETKSFVAGGFDLPVAKSVTSWIDAGTIFVTTDFGPGSLTTSGYPRLVKHWRRGTPLAEAELVYEAPAEHVWARPMHLHHTGYERDLVNDASDFFRSRTYLLRDGGATLIDVPEDAVIDVHREWLLIRPRSDWSVAGAVFPAGTLLATNFDAYLAGERTFAVLFAPDERTTLEHWSWTRNHLLLTLLHDVASRIVVLTPGAPEWERRELPLAEPFLNLQAEGVDEDENDDYWLTATGFTQPTSLRLGTVGDGATNTVKTTPSFFDEAAFAVEQQFVRSADGTRVPYFLIAPKNLVRDGSHPTILMGYGGFEISRTPVYHGGLGRAWLEREGVLAVANIRGGGEYGPRWHTSAMRENRPRAYEDFAAVAQDLIDRRVTSPKHLGCWGGSNGGLLVGNMLTHYPHLFGAIVCNVPLLDMKRYVHLSAGASWIAEYGDPENPDDWAFIQTFSPYHNLREGVDYPSILFYTATSDDRVGPVQARKMAARMQARGIPDALFYENREGGHGGAADNKQSAHMTAVSLEFMLQRLS